MGVLGRNAAGDSDAAGRARGWGRRGGMRAAAGLGFWRSNVAMRAGGFCLDLDDAPPCNALQSSKRKCCPRAERFSLARRAGEA